MFQIFDIASSGMSAQSVRLNTVASNLANADSMGTTAEDTYRARSPIFRAMLLDQAAGAEAGAGVRVTGMVESQDAPMRIYAPENPLADEEGYVYRSNVSVVEEMANMTSASQTYQTNVEMLSTVKRLMLATLRLGQQ